jgi:HAD superfamily hydrolase (TIGR01490 family)
MAGAAFYDVDGTLVSTSVVHTYGYYATHQPTITGSLWTAFKTVAQIPLFAALDQVSRKLFNDLFYKSYEGMSRDRLLTLAEDMFEEVLKPAIYPGAYDLIAESKRAGLRQVMVSGALDFTIAPLAQHLGMDDVIANRLEFLGDVATGRVRRPLLAGATKAAAMRAYCDKQTLDLTESYAYSDSYSDYAMLAVVGRPMAVNPDLRLRSVARSNDWPMVWLNR